MTAITAVEMQVIHSAITQAAAAALQIGQPLGGGFYAGQVRKDDGIHVLVVAPKDGGEHEPTIWNSSMLSVDGAMSYFDGRANTKAMAGAGSDIAMWALGLQLNGFHDWYLPARDEQELVYRNLKPTEGNYASYRDGDNPSSVPVGYPYTEDFPAQTAAEIFQTGAAEAFAEGYYWTSTRHAEYSHDAWVQDFGGGDQDYYHKGLEYRARAVRSMLVIQ